MPHTRWLTTNEMAVQVDLHPKTLLKYAKARRIPADYLIVIGRRFRWRADFAQRPIFLDVPTTPVVAPPDPVRPPLPTLSAAIVRRLSR